MRLNKLLFNKANYLLNYKEFGNPKVVINLLKETLPDPSADQIQLKFLCSPINPSDLNQIQGVYPKRPKLTPEFGAIGGNEGVAQIVEIGKNLQNKFSVGDWVIPNKSCFGTWRKFGNFLEEEVCKVPKVEGVEPAMVGMLSVNPSTAYRMLKDFANLKQGDWIIQNGSNSAVGQSIIQLCKIWGINTLNIVREREGIEIVKEELKQLGANIVVTDKEFRSSEFQENLKSKKASIKVGFNCVGGKLVNDMAKVLENKSYLVTYGGMSREPVTLATSNLIFKQINFTGYWQAEWSESASLKDRQEMWKELLKLMSSGKFKLPPYEIINFREGDELGFDKIKQSLTLSGSSTGGSKLKKLIQFD